MAGKFNAGTMKVERGALLWCAFQWRRKPRWRPPPRKKQGDERAKGVVDGRADPADRRRAVGNCLSARGAGAQGIRGGKRFVGSGRIAAAFAGVPSIRKPGAVNGAEVHRWIQKNCPELKR